MKGPAAWLGAVVADLRISLVFCTRFPAAPVTPVTGADVARASWAMPISGALVGGIGALAYWTAHQLGLPAPPAAALALLATATITGCLHEDGLADTADGFGGGKDREQRLAIMWDSRLGTYGGCALAASFGLRWSALASIAEPALVAMALVATHASARAALPIFMRLVPPARAAGLSAAAGRPSLVTAAIAALLGVVALIAAFGPFAATGVLVLLACAGAALGWLCRQAIGGQTGDVLGALEQASECLVLLAAAAMQNLESA